MSPGKVQTYIDIRIISFNVSLLISRNRKTQNNA